jgi:L-asparaginase II
MALPVLGEVVRSGFVEGHHVGSVLAVRPDGQRVLALGSPDQPVFPRSANKPLQVAAMLRAGLDLDANQLAVAAASHNGEDHHLALVDAILAGVGLSSSALFNTPGLPLDDAAAIAVRCAGGGASARTHNCSGRHAAMLATCVANGWPIASYLERDHPLQRAIATGLAELAGEPIAAVGVDGCRAPQQALTIAGLAHGFQRLVTADSATSERRVADAMPAHPATVGGHGRVVSQLMTGVPGLLAKDGAEGVFVAATADGGAAAVKIADGAQRAAVPVLVAALRALGVTADILEDLAVSPVLGGGRVVGQIRAVM